MQNLIGQTLRDYTILRRIGRGGMAEVFLARQKSLQRNVALKILKPELATDESYVKRFHREAQSAAALVQANIVQVFEVGQDQGLHFIAQEYVPGRNLRQYIDRYGSVEPIMALNLLIQSAQALQKATEFNVVHRDIKPENLLLSSSGEIKITDFGLARVNNDSSRQALTQVGITMGTPLYMSPEQVEGGAIDSRSDIYSLGVTAYHALAGRPPFDGETALVVAVKHVKSDPIPLESIRPDAPKELCDLIHRMMAKQPAKRPQDPASLLKELREIQIESADWDAIVAKLSTQDMRMSSATTSLSEARLAATRQLQALMSNQVVRPWWKRKRVLATTAILSLAGVLAGYAMATWTRPAFPLDVNQTQGDRVTRRDTVEQQFSSASFGSLRSVDPVRRTELWKAVIDYFPLEESTEREKTRYYHRQALVRLGELHLANENLPLALETYEQLAAEKSSLFPRFEAIGNAGQLVVYSRSAKLAGGTEAQQKKIAEYQALIGDQYELLDSFMRKEVENIQVKVEPAMEPTPASQ